MSVRAAQATVDSEEFTYWMAYDAISPIGPERADLQAGLIAYTTAKCHTSKPIKPEDFILNFEDKRKSRRTNDPVAILHQLTLYANSDAQMRATRHGNH